MNVKQLILLCFGGYRMEFKAEEAVAAQIMADFLDSPTPFKQSYDILVGNASAGFTESTLGIDWKQDFQLIVETVATEQPPPEA